jgi:uncharacterized membrane protein YqhA
MAKFLSNFRYMAYLGIVCLLLTSFSAFAWGALLSWHTIQLVFVSLGQDSSITVDLIMVVDAFLIATTLLIFAMSLYEMFIGEIALPEWMLAHNLHELKAKLSSMVVLVMAVKFLEQLVETHDAAELLNRGLATALVSAALIAFAYFGQKD